jgi:hypothetical protein
MPDDFRLDVATPDEREALAPLRASQWRGVLSVSQFEERNRRLYAHPFGRNRIVTWVLRDSSGRIVSSMDELTIRMAVRGAEAPARFADGVLIASVITPAEERGRGYCSQLLDAYFSTRQELSGILYSDIGPAFYRRYGFRERPVRAAEIAVRPPPTEASPARSVARNLSLEAFCERLGDLRRQQVDRSAGPGAALAPDPDWLDWQLERYRFFSELRKRRFPRTLFSEAAHPSGPHLFAAVPDFLTSRLEAFWVDPRCALCVGSLHQIAAQNGLQAIRFWTEVDTSWPGKNECPMVRVGGEAGETGFIDPQFCDWW